MLATPNNVFSSAASPQISARTSSKGLAPNAIFARALIHQFSPKNDSTFLNQEKEKKLNFSLC
jgi:hypothetical protein